MTNNDILRRIRYTFNFTDTRMAEIFALADYEASIDDITAWLKKDDDPEFKSLHDKNFAIFLNGLISHKRGRKEGPAPKPEKTLTNNIIFRKLRIALNLTDIDILEIYQLVGISVSKHELSALFRSPTQPQYRECKDQFLRNFLHGMQLKYRKD